METAILLKPLKEMLNYIYVMVGGLLYCLLLLSK